DYAAPHSHGDDGEHVHTEPDPDSVARLCVAKFPAGSVVKVSACGGVGHDAPMAVGDTAVAVMGDGTVLQLKLLDATTKSDGDTEDTATFEILAYEAGTPMIEVF